MVIPLAIILGSGIEIENARIKQSEILFEDNSGGTKAQGDGENDGHYQGHGAFGFEIANQTANDQQHDVDPENLVGRHNYCGVKSNAGDGCVQPRGPRGTGPSHETVKK